MRVLLHMETGLYPGESPGRFSCGEVTIRKYTFV
jgi:hypothetical protein